MARSKATWYVKLARWPVSWTCAHAETRREYDFRNGDRWARFVTLTLTTDDGRDIELRLTPDEAVTLGKRLTASGNTVDRLNAEQRNGYPL